MSQSIPGPPGRPANVGQAQLWWDIQEIIGPAHLWPRLIRHMFWQRHLRYQQRQIIAAFVFVNGLNPEIFLEWVAIKNLARDHAAVQHFQYLFSRFEEDPTKYGYGLYAYNVTLGHYQKIDGSRHTY